jgi:hypothetical protein
MNSYHATYGAYVRMYADHQFEAEDDSAALASAIDEFKKHGGEFGWTEEDYDNLALPSIVGLQDTELGKDIVEGHDFAANEADARDLASQDLLASLKEILFEIDQEIGQRQTSGNDESWADLQQKSDRAHAAVKKAETVD